MRELSLHILDAVRNCIEAGATHVDLAVTEDTGRDRLEILIRDDGRGMDAEALARVTDAFYTTRTTRRVGLGVALFAATCEQAGGGLEVASTVGAGTLVRAHLRLGHVDRPPLGDMGAVIQALACEADRVALHYTHEVDGARFEVSTRELQEELMDVPVAQPMVLRWIASHVEAGLKYIGSTA